MKPRRADATSAPQITKARYDGTQIQIWWTPVSDTTVTGYTLVAASSDNGTPYQSTVQGYGTSYGAIALPAPLNDNIVYTIQVQEQGGAGMVSPTVPLLTTLPWIRGVYYDGAQVLFWWAPVPGAAGGYLLTVYSTASGASQTVILSDPLARSGVIACGALDPSQTWMVSVAVQGQNGVLGSAPAMPLPAAGAFSLTYAAYRGGVGLVASWQPLAWASSYVLEVTSPVDDTFYEVTLPSGATNGIVPLPAPLDPTRPYALRALALGSNEVGLATPATPIVAALPAILGTSYDGSAVTLTWATSGDPSVTGYTLQVISLASGSTTTSAVSGSTTSSGAVTTGELAAAQPYVASVVTQTTTTIPGESARIPLLVAQPVLVSLGYDGARVTATWTPVAGAGVTSYTFTVAPASGPPLVTIVTGELASAAEIALAGPLTGGYTATVSAAAGASSAVSAALALDVAPPAVATVTYASGAVTATWTTSSDPDVGGYLLTVASTTSSQSFSTVVSGNGATSGTVTAGGLLGTGGGYVVTVAAQHANGVSAQSAPIPLVTSLPELTSVAYDGSAVAATWARVADPNALVSSLALTVRPAAASTPTATTSIADPTAQRGSVAAAALSGSYVVEIRAVSTVGATTVTAVSPPVAVVTAAPAITSASFDGEVVLLAWSAVAGAAGAVAQVTSGGAPVASATVTGTSAVLPLRAGTAPLSVTVAATAGSSTGPSAATVTFPAQPQITSATTDPASGKTTLTWVSASAGSYSVQLFQDGAPSGAPASVTGASYLIPDALLQGVVMTATVTAVAPGAVAATGPASPPFTLMTTLPTLLGVTFDGTSATVTWAPVAGAPGYGVTILQNGTTPVGSTTVVGATANSASVTPIIADVTQTFTAVVQAIAGARSGPPTAPVNIFTPAYFVSTQPAATAAPSVFMGATLARAASTVTAYLPGIGALTGLPLTQGAFTLQANPDAATSATYPYELVIPAGSEAWTFTSASIRAQLQTDYVSFLQAAETSGATPWGVSLLQQVVSRVMPQTFAETLYYAYGLDLVKGTADLRPGMVLRVAMGDYLYLGTSTAQPWLNGYAAGPVIDYDVASYATASGWLVGLDAFVAQLVAGGALQIPAPEVNAPQMSGVADAADLFYPLFQAPFFRVFFPSTLLTPTGLGSTTPASNFAIAAAPSYTALAAAGNVPTGSNALAYFRGRVVLKLGVRVTVNGTEQLVSLGTTVGDLLDRAARRPPAAPVSLRGVTLTRSLGPAVLDPTAPYDAGSAYGVRLDWGTLPVYAPGVDATSLPLLHGDVLTLG